ncbi:MAG: hypothetical protein H6883_02185 [Rhodobiaceae bacterium]|nr:hypothetical protein [Rhodobiaceae bacterium]MCC0054926.1 hypothetical protein [Rhodobiaceae bacterium]
MNFPIERLSIRNGRSGGGSASPFLQLHFAIQSYLHAQRKPFHRRRQAQALLAYAGIVIAAAAANLGYATSAASGAALLGLTFPGAGILHWATAGQLLHAFGFFAASLAIFAGALVLWFTTGNIVAPVAVWIGLAVLSGYPDFFALEAGDGAVDIWPWLIAPAALSVATAGWWRAGRAAANTRIAVAPCRASPTRIAATPAGLSHEDAKRLRLLLDRALQPVEAFDGFERRDQFQTAALRYQVNFMAYALAIAQGLHAPGAHACFADAQMRLMSKIGDRRLWSYWRLENAWGNLRLGSDPVSRQNIMYSGFVALQMALGGNRTLVLHAAGRPLAALRLNDISERLSAQYRSSSYGLLECEPNWIYPLCNLITMTGLKAADARLGTRYWDGLALPFIDALAREGMSRNGSFIAFRSSLTGIGVAAPGGIVMQALPCLFLNALSPDLAQRQWQRVRQRLDRASWPRAFWPVDIGNYGFSRASSYAATAAAAVEMGDDEIATECLHRLESECPSRESADVIHRERASLWAHALELIARCNHANGLRNLTTRRDTGAGPQLMIAPYPEIVIRRAISRGDILDILIEPGRPDVSSVLEFGDMKPQRLYRTGLPAQPFIKSDRLGRARLRIALVKPTRIALEPVV